MRKTLLALTAGVALLPAPAHAGTVATSAALTSSGGHVRAWGAGSVAGDWFDASCTFANGSLDATVVAGGGGRDGAAYVDVDLRCYLVFSTVAYVGSAGAGGTSPVAASSSTSVPGRGAAELCLDLRVTWTHPTVASLVEHRRCVRPGLLFDLPDHHVFIPLEPTAGG